ncbi:MAG: DNA-binding protein [Candidatus Hydrothermarchaeota archaeon]|nr:MAG: DNA-binding protein [Candidatus Hydrothermarchaeota archaeon]
MENYGDSMKISDLKSGMSNVDIKAKIIDMSETRNVQTRYGPRSVANATLEDETGQISLSLWESQISSVSIGDIVSIKGGYVTEFRNKLQLNIPRAGKIEVVRE